MSNSGEKKFALCATEKINILTLVLSEKKILNEAKNQCRTKSYKDSFFPTVLDLWNKLDNDTRNIQSLSSLKD